MRLSLAYSPCPNDTFIFDAIANGRIDTEGLQFDITLADVEQLNLWAMEDAHDITKLSFHAFAYVSESYAILSSGAALGRGCGPLLISRDEIPRSKIEFCLLGIPGRHTTANFLSMLAFPEAATKKEMMFSDIEQALLDGSIDIGLIIHENRFTYQQKGLRKIADLGEWWETKYRMPIPLGGIAARKSLGKEQLEKINRVIRRSVEYAFAHPGDSSDYVCAHAQEMDPQVMQQHIDLYVNDYSVDLGEEGKSAIDTLYRVALEKKVISHLYYPLFADQVS